MSPKKVRKLSRAQTEPAVVRGLVVAVLTLLSAMGIAAASDPSRETIAALVTVASVVIPLIQALWTRFAVTANDKVIARLSTSTGNVIAGPAAAAPTGSVVRIESLPTGDPTRGDHGRVEAVAVEVDPTLVE
jgi:hypothetical protein